MTTVGIINYGVGNLASLVRSFERLRTPAALVDQPEAIAACDRLILPGVGHFNECASKFAASGLRSAVEQAVFGDGKPLLGICVGYQIMARGSEEGSHPGLGWIDAGVKRFPSSWGGQPLRVPHVGWNRLTEWRGPLLEQLDHEPRFYFTHSYYVVPDTPDISIGVCHYGLGFVAAAQKGRIYGVQFHPEKSHGAGLNLIRNFVDRC